MTASGPLASFSAGFRDVHFPSDSNQTADMAIVR
jgi:hypothetical protein